MMNFDAMHEMLEEAMICLIQLVLTCYFIDARRSSRPALGSVMPDAAFKFRAVRVQRYTGRLKRLPCNTLQAD